MDQDQANKLVAALNAAYPEAECSGCADPLTSEHDTACPGTSYEEEATAVFARLDFKGHDGRECGEHRSTGPRAWCHDCGEWCYPATPCKGCELPKLHARVSELEAEVERLREEMADNARELAQLRPLLRVLIRDDARAYAADTATAATTMTSDEIARDPEYIAHQGHDGRGRNDCPYCPSVEDVAADDAGHG